MENHLCYGKLQRTIGTCRQQSFDCIVRKQKAKKTSEIHMDLHSRSRPVSNHCWFAHCVVCSLRPSKVSKVKKVKVKVADLHSSSIQSVSKELRYSMHCQGITQFYLHTLHFICKWNELYLPLP